MILVRKDDHSVRITGTVERLLGTCDIQSVTPDGDGRFFLEFGYCGTEINWDSSETMTEDGVRVFEDENGRQVLESECELIEEGEEE